MIPASFLFSGVKDQQTPDKTCISIDMRRL
jgi:hypothetical protein